MKIKIEELKKLAKQINIEMSDQELDQIDQAINKITDKLDQVLEEDVEGFTKTRTSSEKKQVFANEEENNKQVVNEFENEYMDLNNFDGEYVNLVKEEVNDEL